MSKKNQVTLTKDTLTLGGSLQVSLMRTLRVPDDGRRYPLPPGLGRFPLRRVDDYADRVPRSWRRQGGLFLPMYQREAMWLSFVSSRPVALKVGVGKVCALTGKGWSETLHRRPQDYLVAPDQPWLDGIVVKKGVIRQFVAMPLGLGYTVEGQVTGEERFGGIQLKVFEARPGALPAPSRRLRAFSPAMVGEAAASSCSLRRKKESGEMGLGAGGSMAQKVYPDPHGVDLWDPRRTSRIFIHLVNSEQWQEITGEAPPTSPVTARAYSQAGLPWFELYDESEPALSPTRTLKKVKSIKELDKKRSKRPLQDDAPVDAGPLHKLWHHLRRGGEVRDGRW